jgi:hypothetical protein
MVAPFRVVNAYGLFAAMTTERPEILVEGSRDGLQWAPYEFKFKPGDVRRPLRWVAPHQPRLDWQMWFAALDPGGSGIWLNNFCSRLREGSRAVIGLLAADPFGTDPPRFVRAALYHYRFADRATQTRDGAWWVREEIGPLRCSDSP